jgi:hypothetical protein
MPENIQVSISQESVQQIIDAKIQAAVMQALQPNADKLVDQLVTKVLTQESPAEKYRYGYHNKKKPTVLQEMLETMVEEQVRLALRDWLEQNKEQFAKKLRDYIAKKPQFATAMAEQMLLGVIQASQWNFKVEVAAKER